ncbi:hypothetical protein MP228_004203 [Amoeboaphelidium protococcarum]|nr:hypothetical protein MP228_004203 [Amoeboaphelidium protococcarum]
MTVLPQIEAILNQSHNSLNKENIKEAINACDARIEKLALDIDKNFEELQTVQMPAMKQQYQVSSHKHLPSSTIITQLKLLLDQQVKLQQEIKRIEKFRTLQDLESKLDSMLADKSQYKAAALLITEYGGMKDLKQQRLQLIQLLSAQLQSQLSNGDDQLKLQSIVDTYQLLHCQGEFVMSYSQWFIDQKKKQPSIGDSTDHAHVMQELYISLVHEWNRISGLDYSTPDQELDGDQSNNFSAVVVFLSLVQNILVAYLSKQSQLMDVSLYEEVVQKLFQVEELCGIEDHGRALTTFQIDGLKSVWSEPLANRLFSIHLEFAEYCQREVVAIFRDAQSRYKLDVLRLSEFVSKSFLKYLNDLPSVHGRLFYQYGQSYLANALNSCLVKFIDEFKDSALLNLIGGGGSRKSADELQVTSGNAVDYGSSWQILSMMLQIEKQLYNVITAFDKVSYQLNNGAGGQDQNQPPVALQLQFDKVFDESTSLQDFLRLKYSNLSQTVQSALQMITETFVNSLSEYLLSQSLRRYHQIDWNSVHNQFSANKTQFKDVLEFSIPVSECMTVFGESILMLPSMLDELKMSAASSDYQTLFVVEGVLKAVIQKRFQKDAAVGGEDVTFQSDITSLSSQFSPLNMEKCIELLVNAMCLLSIEELLSSLLSVQKGTLTSYCCKQVLADIAYFENTIGVLGIHTDDLSPTNDNFLFQLYQLLFQKLKIVKHIFTIVAMNHQDQALASSRIKLIWQYSASGQDVSQSSLVDEDISVVAMIRGDDRIKKCFVTTVGLLKIVRSASTSKAQQQQQEGLQRPQQAS